jgi:hypothetical protein
MKRDARWRQLDLLMLCNGAAVQSRRLDPSNRAEITALLKLLIDECVDGRSRMKEVVDEQGHA